MAQSSPKPVYSGESNSFTGILPDSLDDINSTIDGLIADGFDILDDSFQQGIDLLLNSESSQSASLNSYIQGGKEAFDRALAMQGLGDNPMTARQLSEQFLNTPGMQFQLNQGRRALESSASSKGLLGSGRTAKALMEHGQGIAGQYRNETIAQLTNLAQLGLGATSAQTERSGQAAQLLASKGQAKADLLQNSEQARISALSQNKYDRTVKTGVRLGNLFITAGAAGA